MVRKKINEFFIHTQDLKIRKRKLFDRLKKKKTFFHTPLFSLFFHIFSYVNFMFFILYVIFMQHCIGQCVLTPTPYPNSVIHFKKYLTLKARLQDGPFQRVQQDAPGQRDPLQPALGWKGPQRVPLHLRGHLKLTILFKNLGEICGLDGVIEIKHPDIKGGDVQEM